MKAFLLINGNPPKELPELQEYAKIYCTDGAYAHLLQNKIRPDFVIGDFDSIQEDDISPKVEKIKRIDQDFTDFHKCLQVIQEHGFTAVDVYGSTGSEHDHFLGNLTTAHQFKDELNITFLDDYSIFFFTEKQIELEGVKRRMISLYPFPKATQVESEGLFYPLKGMDLDITQHIGTRNHATQKNVKITYKEGDLLVFISKYKISKKDLAYKEGIS